MPNLSYYFNSFPRQQDVDSEKTLLLLSLLHYRLSSPPPFSPVLLASSFLSPRFSSGLLPLSAPPCKSRWGLRRSCNTTLSLKHTSVDWISHVTSFILHPPRNFYPCSTLSHFHLPACCVLTFQLLYLLHAKTTASRM